MGQLKTCPSAMHSTCFGIGRPQHRDVDQRGDRPHSNFIILKYEGVTASIGDMKWHLTRLGNLRATLANNVVPQGRQVEEKWTHCKPEQCVVETDDQVFFG